MPGIYRPRQPERTVLYRVLFHSFDLFLSVDESRFEKEYGHFRPVVKMDDLELIARVTSHIPDKGQIMVRYDGLYANAQIHPSSGVDVRGREAAARLCLSLVIFWFLTTAGDGPILDPLWEGLIP